MTNTAAVATSNFLVSMRAPWRKMSVRFPRRGLTCIILPQVWWLTSDGTRKRNLRDRRRAGRLGSGLAGGPRRPAGHALRDAPRPVYAGAQDRPPGGARLLELAQVEPARERPRPAQGGAAARRLAAPSGRPPRGWPPPPRSG